MEKPSSSFKRLVNRASLTPKEKTIAFRNRRLFEHLVTIHEFERRYTVDSKTAIEVVIPIEFSEAWIYLLFKLVSRKYKDKFPDAIHPDFQEAANKASKEYVPKSGPNLDSLLTKHLPGEKRNLIKHPFITHDEQIEIIRNRLKSERSKGVEKKEGSKRNKDSEEKLIESAKSVREEEPTKPLTQLMPKILNTYKFDDNQSTTLIKYKEKNALNILYRVKSLKRRFFNFPK